LDAALSIPASSPRRIESNFVTKHLVGDPLMSNMEMSGGNTQDPEMRDMMAAPLPFGIMIGRTARWMVGYQFKYEQLDGMRVGSNRVSDASVLDNFATAPDRRNGPSWYERARVQIGRPLPTASLGDTKHGELSEPFDRLARRLLGQHPRV
jgi:hypothetical protein